MLRSSTRSLSRSRVLLTGSTAKPVSYSKTLQLPKTAFGPKIPNLEAAKPLISKSSQELYKWQSTRDTHGKEFTLLDGPPYANGDLHLGHALNKITKDIVNRFELIHNGAKVVYQPGWDCHGLPIEMKAITKSDKQLSAKEIRKLCRDLALYMINKQREQFTQFAVMTDFTKPYVTMDHKYEIDQLKVFGKLVKNGLLSRQQKPVWWGTETETALAEAELEYNNNHHSVAVHVKYPIKDPMGPLLGLSNVKLLIWTSTPWTLPANKAICVNTDVDYTVLHNETTGEHIVVADELCESLLKLNDEYVKLEGLSFTGDKLLGMQYSNPLSQGSSYPILHGDHVTSSAGTGLVHTAPAHGGDDYLIGKKHNLEIISSVDGKGKFHGVGIPQELQFLKGLHLSDSIWKIITLYRENDMIFHVNKKFKHSYPYDWRSNKPVIQRATPQWFINVDKIKETAVKSLEDVKFFPESGKNRLLLFVNNRNEWCISRQRVWGVPLPIVYERETNEPIENFETIMDHIIERMDVLGTDEWFEVESDISRWLPEGIDGTRYVKGLDTMDVWFDSGTSWTTMEQEQADVYLEGSDQHRGWFQSSLLNKIIASGVNGTDFKPVAPFKEIITHGFTLDSKNDKMSKSKGNIISPVHAMSGGGKPFLPALSVDGLRLWVASSNYTLDVNVTTEVLTRVFENLKKIRITLKYLLGNLNEFNRATDGVQYDQLNPLDKYVLSKLVKLQEACTTYYQEHNFQRVVKDINHFVSTDLSSLYFDISKDSLYTDAKNSHKRRSIQTVLEVLLRTQIGILAPIQPLVTQEVWETCSQDFTGGSESPFMKDWDSFYKLPKEYSNAKVEDEFNKIWEIKNSLYKSLEVLRQAGSLKSNLELQVNLEVSTDSGIGKILLSHSEFLEDYFLVSKVTINGSTEAPETTATSDIDGENVKISVSRSDSHKCPRCWKFVAPVENELCVRCDSVVGN